MTQKRGEKQSENIADDSKPSEVQRPGPIMKDPPKHLMGFGMKIANKMQSR